MQNVIHKCFPRKYNILCYAIHERQDSYMAKTGHNFYAIMNSKFKHWETKFAPVPDSFNLLRKSDDTLSTIPPHIDFDFIISGSKFGHFQLSKQLQSYLNIPILSVEHTLPMKGYWSQEQIDNLNSMRGEHNVFISDYSMKDWGFQNNGDTEVVRHCVDSELFQDLGLERERTILTICNGYKERDFFLNYKQYVRVTEGLPTRPVGDTPGLSEPTGSLDELINHYNTCQIFLNTAHVSPIPTVLMEAMSCGLVPVSCNTCAIPEFIEHEKTGFLYDSDEECRKYLELLLDDKELCTTMGQAARESMIEKFGVPRFVDDWNRIYDKVANMAYRG